MLYYINLPELLLLYDKPNITYKDLLSVYSISNISKIASLEIENVIRDLVFILNIFISIRYYIIGFLNLLIKILLSDNNNNITLSANSKQYTYILYNKCLK